MEQQQKNAQNFCVKCVEEGHHTNNFKNFLGSCKKRMNASELCRTSQLKHNGLKPEIKEGKICENHIAINCFVSQM